MTEQPYQMERYGKTVWVSPALERIRNDECLCLHCSKLKRGGAPDNCPIAAKLFAVCVEHGVATPISRCPEWQAV